MTESSEHQTPFSKVDFGRYDAESDPNLLEYFLVTGTTKDAAGGAQLVIGRKGAGKTALFKHLFATLDSRVVDLDLTEYVFQVHKKLLDSGLSREFAYTSSWRLLILSAMFARVRDDLPKVDRRKGDDALKAIGLGKNGGAFRAMLDWLARVRKVKLPSVTGVADGGSLELDSKTESVLDTATADGLSALEDVLAAECIRQPVTVLLDRLDDAWDGSKESLDLITGAVRATRALALRLPQSGPSPVVTFLRTDLWEKLSFNDRNKMSQDIIFLDWSTGELEDVIDRRVVKSAGVKEGHGWETAFTQSEMRQRASAKTYVLKRTIGRPRDVVAFSTFALKEARTNGHERIESDDIYAAEKRYSKHALDELRDEIERHVGDFAEVVNTLKGLGKRTFSASDWQQSAISNGMSGQEAERVLEQLFEASAVGVHRAGGATGGSRTTFRYQDRHLRSTDEALLQVHLAFVRELGLKDS